MLGDIGFDVDKAAFAFSLGSLTPRFSCGLLLPKVEVLFTQPLVSSRSSSSTHNRRTTHSLLARANAPRSHTRDLRPVSAKARRSERRRRQRRRRRRR